MDDIRQVCSDSGVSDDGSSSGGGGGRGGRGGGLRPLRSRPLYVVRGWMTLWYHGGVFVCSETC